VWCISEFFGTYLGFLWDMLGHVGTCWDMFGDFSDLDQKSLKKHPRSQFPTVGIREPTPILSFFA
jgi:hypothetical protein